MLKILLEKKKITLMWTEITTQIKLTHCCQFIYSPFTRVHCAFDAADTSDFKVLRSILAHFGRWFTSNKKWVDLQCYVAFS